MHHDLRGSAHVRTMSLVAFLSLCLPVACEGAFILSDWTPSGSAWSLTNQNTTATGPNNNSAGVQLLRTPAQYNAHRFIGTMRVDEFTRTDNGGDWDDDFLGLAFAVQNFGSAHNYFLIDWKQAPQGNALEGLRLMRVQTSTALDLFQVLPGVTPGVSLIAASQGAGKGWLPNITYTFRLTHTPDSLTLRLQGGSGPYATETTVFDVAGNFPAGRFAFATYSQPNNRFRLDEIQSIPEPVGLSGAGLVIFFVLRRRD